MGKRGRRGARRRPALAELGCHGTGDRFGPIVEAWVLDDPLTELLVLHGPESPAALQRALVIPGRRVDTMPDEPAWALTRAHGDDPTGMIESVTLAVTDRRWTRVAREVLERLEADGVLDHGHVSQLSVGFLEGDDVLVTVPGAWVVDYYLQQRDGEPARVDPAKTYTLSRQVNPHMRRWAAAQYGRDREGIARVLRRASQLDSKHAAAAVLGLVDAADHLAQPEATEVLELGADWPASQVRLAALKKLVEVEPHAQALDRAASDGAATVRRWAARHRQASLLTPGRQSPVRTDDGGAGQAVDRPDTPPRRPEQQSLFA